MIPDLSLTIGSVRITPFFWGLFLATIVSSFSFWRRLREDYPEEFIFSQSLLLLVFSLFFSRLFFVIFNFDKFGLSLFSFLTLNFGGNFSLIGAIFGAILAVVWQMSGKKGSLWEALDSLALPFLYFFILAGAGIFLTNQNFRDLCFPAVGLLGFFLYPLLKKSYRSFVWYKSGRTGFLISIYGLFVSLFLLVLAFIKNDKIYLEGTSRLLLFLISAGALYYRSERNLKEDLGGLFKKEKK